MLVLANKQRQTLALSLRKDTSLISLEGTIRSSKTVEAIECFGFRCLMFKGKLSVIAGKDTDTIMNNILYSNGYGLLEQFDGSFELKKDKIGSYYVSYQNKYGEDCKILLCGYDNSASWKKIVGLTITNFLVDEVNLANKQFIDEAFSRQASVDYPFNIWTLNGDNPDHYIYQEYINRCKALLDVPKIILDQMNAVENKKGWYYYHYNFHDNPEMNEEKIARAMELYPINSYYYKIKILGIRGKAEGTIFADTLDNTFISLNSGYRKDDSGNLIEGSNGLISDIIRYSIGIDLGNNEIKHGTVITISAITRGFREVVVLDVKECKSTEVNALIEEMADFIMLFYDNLVIKNQLDGVWVDGYGAIEMIMSTLRNKLRSKGYMGICALVNKFGKDNGRKARLDTLMLLIGARRITFRPKAKFVVMQLSKLVYDKDGLPLDENQLEMDYYDSLGYSLSTSMLELNKYFM